MKFQEILTELESGKKAHFGCHHDEYLLINNSNLSWFEKSSNKFLFYFDGSVSCLSDEWKIYDEKSELKKEKKLSDFNVNWYPTIESMNRNEKEFIDDGFETFRKESVDFNNGLMCHKLMMVKYV